MKPIIIALYLPQFYPTKENDKWWGKGFTEWTNVGRAKPLWKGHDQPRVPTDLGYYDLRMPEIREQQVELAKEAGVTAFCYWYYWFGHGKRMLADVFNEVLLTGNPNFPFCLGWANHSWYAKSWDKTVKDKLLVKQEYPGIEDDRKHFDFLSRAFLDKRYLKINGKPFFYIFDPFTLPRKCLENFREWVKDIGFSDLYIVANSYDVTKSPKEFKQMGYDAVSYARITSLWSNEYFNMSLVGKMYNRVLRVIKQYVTGKPRGAIDYKKNYHAFITNIEREREVIPQIVPQWDHSPRSGNKASIIFYNSSPESFASHVKQACFAIKDKPVNEQLLILKSWNEWGEGNYMEPDLSHGKGYIKALANVLKELR